MAQEIGLHSLKPKPGSRHRKKRVGRGEGSGMGKTSGRGEKGAGSRSGSKSRSNFEGGQMPIHMRLRKLRGPSMKKSMPFEQFGRTHTQPVNLKDLEARFEAGDEVTPESLKAKGLATRKDIPVKILGQGELKKKLTIRVHFASASAREKIEGAGGSVELLVEPKKQQSKPKQRSPEAQNKPPKAEQPEPDADAEPSADAEPDADAEPSADAEPEPDAETRAPDAETPPPEDE